MGVFGHFRPYGPPANRATSRSSTPRHAASLGRRRRRSRAMEGFVTVFFWQHDLDPAFPLSVLEYETRDADDQMHWHEYLEIALCLQGGGQFLFGRRSYPAEPGDVFLIDDAEPHVGVPAPPNRMRHLLDANLRRALAVLVRYARASESAPDGSATPGDRHEQVRPVLSYVEQHFRESLTLERVSEHVHVSASRVRHLFKDVTSVGFKEYVTNLRLSEAKRLLLTSDTCVQEVAYTVGYTNH